MTASHINGPAACVGYGTHVNCILVLCSGSINCARLLFAAFIFARLRREPCVA